MKWVVAALNSDGQITAARSDRQVWISQARAVKGFDSSTLRGRRRAETPRLRHRPHGLALTGRRLTTNHPGRGDADERNSALWPFWRLRRWRGWAPWHADRGPGADRTCPGNTVRNFRRTGWNTKGSNAGTMDGRNAGSPQGVWKPLQQKGVQPRVRLENGGQTDWSIRASKARTISATIEPFVARAVEPGMTTAKKPCPSGGQEITASLSTSTATNNELGNPGKVFNVTGTIRAGNDHLTRGAVRKPGFKVARRAWWGTCTPIRVL